MTTHQYPPESFCGTNADRAGVGLRGHCDRCAEVGHVKAHPDLGCGDVGCNVEHGPENELPTKCEPGCTLRHIHAVEPVALVPGRATAIRALVRAKQLLADLDRSARSADVRTVRIAVDHEITTALEGLQAGVTGDRPGKVRRDAEPTSRRAALRVKVKTGTQRAKILLAIAEPRGLKGERGLTDHEVHLLTGIQPNSIRPRRGELCDTGYVQATDLWREHNGEQWTVWTVTEVGLALAESLAREAPQRNSGLGGEQMALG